MKDRVSRYPGRVRLTPVSGQANVYDMELADSPSVAGTPLNKANLLTDATASLFSYGSSATPNQILSKLGNAVLYNGSTLKKPNGTTVTIPSSQVSSMPASNIIGLSEAIFVTGTYTGDGTTGQTIRLGFTPEVVIIAEGGASPLGARDEGAVLFNGGESMNGSKVVTNGFVVSKPVNYPGINVKGTNYYYMAFK